MGHNGLDEGPVAIIQSYLQKDAGARARVGGACTVLVESRGAPLLSGLALSGARGTHAPTTSSPIRVVPRSAHEPRFSQAIAKPQGF